MPKNVFEENIVSRVRDQLGDHNDPRQPIEWCVQDMRLASERLKKTVAEAEKEVEQMYRLIQKQEQATRAQKSTTDRLAEVLLKASSHARTHA